MSAPLPLSMTIRPDGRKGPRSFVSTTTGSEKWLRTPQEHDVEHRLPEVSDCPVDVGQARDAEPRADQGCLGRVELDAGHLETRVASRAQDTSVPRADLEQATIRGPATQQRCSGSGPSTGPPAS